MKVVIKRYLQEGVSVEESTGIPLTFVIITPGMPLLSQGQRCMTPSRLL